ncbi:MAG: endonuclease domain-containing protein [Alphaproteobacteria bacterium]|nr:endonuclease domain-containing protein [Alphaproteobacteria bacterium]
MRGPDAISTERARALRRRSTRAELALWRHLRDRQLAGFKFVRQEPVGPYFADFACRERYLVVEVDGGQHAKSGADAKRDATMRDLGYKIIRVWNSDILGNIEGVLQMLSAELEYAPHPANGEREPH